MSHNVLSFSRARLGNGENDTRFAWNTISHLSAITLQYVPTQQTAYLLVRRECPYTWRYGTMQLLSPPGVYQLPVHEGSLRLLRSEVFSDAIVKNTGITVLQKDEKAMLSSINASLRREVNLRGYLSHGLKVVKRLPDITVTTTPFVAEPIATTAAYEALNAFIELGKVYCGEGVSEVLSVVCEDTEAIDACIADAVQSHIGRELSVRLASICRKVAAEYDIMATVLSLDEASNYLNTRLTGNSRLVTLMKLLLRTGKLLREDSRNIYVVKRGLDDSMNSFSFLWGGAFHEARRLIEAAKGLIAGTSADQIDFWDLVDRMSGVAVRPRISLDAVVAIALAELGIVVNCGVEAVRVLRTIAGDSAEITTEPVSLTNPGGVWVTPFRALTPRRIVMALDGRTQLRMVDEISGVQGTLGLFAQSTNDENAFLVCEPLPYRHIDDIKSTMPKAFAALATDDQPWNDSLEKALHGLASRAVPPDGLEVEAAVRSAKESFMANNVLSRKYTDVIFQVKRIISVFTLCLEQGRRFGDVLYQYSLFMVHPDISKVGGRRVRELWDNLDEAPEALRRFIDNVRLTHEGWMVYPETGSAGIRHLRRRHTHRYTVWLRCADLEESEDPEEAGSVNEGCSA